MATLSNIFILGREAWIIRNIYMVSGSYKLIVTGIFAALTILGVVVSEFIVAVMFAAKVNVETPLLYLILGQMICCCNKKRAQYLVQILALWNVLLFLQFFIGHGTVILFGLWVSPGTVIPTSMICIFGFFSITHCLAVFFTFGRLNRKRKRSQNSLACVIILGTAETIAFSILSICTLCFGIVIAGIGVMNNYGAQDPRAFPYLSSLFTPFLLTGLCYILKRVGTEWLRSYKANTDLEEAIAEQLQVTADVAKDEVLNYEEI